MNDLEVLLKFLNYPLNNSGKVFARFEQLSGAQMFGEKNERSLYIPGTRKDRVLLIAHADTFWDESFAEHQSNGIDLEIQDSMIRNKLGGLGADDRAGCGIIWLLKEMGHSILITDGEEHGSIGSKWLAINEPEVLEEINSSHQFMVQFDRQNAKDYKTYDVGTNAFRAYVEEKTGYKEPDRLRSTDIKVLCKAICGVNLSIGYYKEHTKDEYLVIDEWARTLSIAREWLGTAEIPKFKL